MPEPEEPVTPPVPEEPVTLPVPDDRATDPAAPATAPAPSSDPTGQVFVAADDEEPGPADEPDAARPSALRTATVISGRIVLGFITLAIIGIVVAVAVLIPIPTLGSKPASRVVVPTATAEQLVCPGGLLQLGSASGANATTASSLGAAPVTTATLGGALQSSEFAVTDAGTAHTSAAPRILSTPPAAAGSAPSRVSGAESQTVATTQITGLASAACTAVSASTWLAGGSTAVGRTTLLLLANPTAVPATVSLQVFGEVGRVTAPGMDGIVVAPGAQRVLSIAGFAPNVASPVVHVTSTGGQVVATLEQTTVRGLVPGGVDFIQGTGGPLSTSIIPGVVISGSAVLQSEIGQSGFDDLQTTLRLFLPGSRSTSASISVLAEDGTVAATPMKTEVNGGRVTDVPIDSLSDGNYTIVVTSRLALVTSVRVSTASAPVTKGPAPAAPSTDFAWMTPAPLLTSSTLLSVAPGISPLLHLENPTATAETVEVAALDGTTQTVTVAAGSATAVTVLAATSYELSGFAKLYASVSGAGDGGITSYVVIPPPRGESALRIFG